MVDLFVYIEATHELFVTRLTATETLAFSKRLRVFEQYRYNVFLQNF